MFNKHFLSIVVTVQEPRPHHFKTAQFYHPTFCTHCGSMIYGLINQGVRCTDCSMTAHHRCQKLVPRACGTDHQEKRGRISLAFYTEKLSDTPTDSVWRINIEGECMLTKRIIHCCYCAAVALDSCSTYIVPACIDWTDSLPPLPPFSSPPIPSSVGVQKPSSNGCQWPGRPLCEAVPYR